MRAGKGVGRGHRNGERAQQGIESDWKPEDSPHRASAKTTNQVLRPISDIKVGLRHRRDLGDIDELAGQIGDIGLLQPIVVKPDGTLIAGQRRLEAVKVLGWKDVPVHVVDIAAATRGEFSENFHRKDFTPSELVSIAEAVLEEERELSRERMTLGKVSLGSLTGKTPYVIAERLRLGISGKTLERARAVVRAAEQEPKKFGRLLADMDRTGRVNGVFKRLQVAKQAESIRREPPPLPNKGPYRVIVADPPWPYEDRQDDPSHMATCPYPTMTIEQICAENVGAIAAQDSILWLWTTNWYMLQGARDVLDAWGFDP